MKTRIILYADEGKILTDGEIYGRAVYLAEGRNADDFHEISKYEYNRILDERTEGETGDV